MPHLRAAYKRLLPADVEFAADVRLVVAVTDPDGKLVELRDPARAKVGERVLLAAVHDESTDGTTVSFNGPDGPLFQLRSERNEKAPVALVGECLPRPDGWWFVELGYGVANGGVLANRLRASGPDRAALTGLASLPAPRPTREPRMLPGARLGEARLVGGRKGGPVRLDVCLDLSGSMTGYAQVRQEALAELITFARTQLTEDDVISVIAFASRAAPITPPVKVRELEQRGETPQGHIGGGTQFIPALQLLKTYPAPKGTPRSLVVITDTYLGDDRRELARELKQAAYRHIYFVVPRLDPRHIPMAREPWFGDVALRNLSDAAQLALTYGEVFATLTGQRLQPAFAAGG